MELRNFEKPESSGGESEGGFEVFNIETESGNYFANGLLVHNCHNLERELIAFNEATVSDMMIQKYRIPDLKVPAMTTIQEHQRWVKEAYLQEAKLMAESMMETNVEGASNAEAAGLLLHIQGLTRTIELIDNTWVFWQEVNDKGRTSYASPTHAAPFFNDLVASSAPVRIFLSAFLGAKPIFCQNLGLDPARVAWLKLSSAFDIENRRNTFIPTGSMGRKSIDATTPKMASAIVKLATKHAGERGVIHCVSYKLGKEMYRLLRGTPIGNRILFPENADQRDAMFAEHSRSTDAILLSPSFAEGYDFKGDLARWQIICKVPYPSLGNLVVRARKDENEEWYGLQTVMKIIQASGRIVRSEDDYGETYILDSDFGFLLKKYEHLFPKWWMDAFCRI